MSNIFQTKKGKKITSGINKTPNQLRANNNKIFQILTTSVWITKGLIQRDVLLASILQYELHNLLTVGNRKIFLQQPLIRSIIWIIYKWFKEIENAVLSFKKIQINLDDK